jgi:hypothetical protein
MRLEAARRIAATRTNVRAHSRLPSSADRLASNTGIFDDSDTDWLSEPFAVRVDALCYGARMPSAAVDRDENLVTTKDSDSIDWPFVENEYCQLT